MLSNQSWYFGLLLVAMAAVFPAQSTPAGAFPRAAADLPAFSDIGIQNPDLLIQARHRHGHRYYPRYSRHHHGHRYRYRRDGYSHFYGGYFYAWPWWYNSLYYYPRRTYAYGAHERWCLNRYRSYNPRTDMFLGYDGRYRYCNSPYD
jgi:hypothetical protein